jgi:hypothetical protein
MEPRRSAQNASARALLLKIEGDPEVPVLPPVFRD